MSQAFIPYIWPIRNRRLQGFAGIVGFCLLAERILNVLVPRQLGIITDKLAKGTGLHFQYTHLRVECVPTDIGNTQADLHGWQFSFTASSDY